MNYGEDDYDEFYADSDEHEDEPYGEPIIHTERHGAVSTNINRFGLPANHPAAKNQVSQTISAKKRSPAFGTIRQGQVITPVADIKMACMRDDVTTIRQAIEDGFSVDTVISSDWTALMYAAHAGSAATVQCLIDAGASVNYHKDMYSVLMAACGSTCGDGEQVLACVQALIKAGAKVNGYDRHHISPLMYAAKEGRADVIRTLVDAGAEMNKQDGRGYTSLMWAVLKRRVPAVFTLLQRGALTGVRDRGGSTVYELAAMEGDSKIQQLLTQHQTNKLSSQGDHLQNVEKIPVTSSSSSSSVASTIHYGDLEMMLSGLELSVYIPSFQAHRVTFEQFLRMTDTDLIPIVPQAGVRKKILDNVAKLHKKEWEVTSLTPQGTLQQQHGGRLTCAEAIFILQNLKKHTAYMASTVAYIRESMTEAALSGAAEGAGAEQLLYHCTEASTNGAILTRELAALGDHVRSTSARAPPPDVIRHVPGVTTTTKRSDVTVKRHKRSVRTYVATSMTLVLIVTLVYKKDAVLAGISSFGKFMQKSVN